MRSTCLHRRGTHAAIRIALAWYAGLALASLLAGCGNILTSSSAPLFAVPLTVEGESVGDAIIDTGGAFEVMLREDFGLRIVDSIEVLVFGGPETVGLTEGFNYTAGGVAGSASGAIVGVSSCDCNGVGIDFLRKRGVILALAFAEPSVAFLPAVPEPGVTFDYVRPPPHLSKFYSSFIEVNVTGNDTSASVLGLLDTGAANTAIRRDVLDDPPGGLTNRLWITVENDYLGPVTVSATLFDTPGLPDVILGTDAMRAWGNRWYFAFTHRGGSVTVVPYESATTESPADGQPAF